MGRFTSRRVYSAVAVDGGSTDGSEFLAEKVHSNQPMAEEALLFEWRQRQLIRID